MGRTLVIDGGHLKRLMGLCRALRTGGDLNVLRLQVKLKMSRRTIFRELNALEGMGVKIELGENGYRVKQGISACRKLLATHQNKALAKLLNDCLK